METNNPNTQNAGTFETNANYIPASLASLRALAAGLPDPLALQFLHTARQVYLTQTTCTSKEVANAALECLFEITEIAASYMPRTKLAA